MLTERAKLRHEVQIAFVLKSDPFYLWVPSVHLTVIFYGGTFFFSSLASLGKIGASTAS